MAQNLREKPGHKNPEREELNHQILYLLSQGLNGVSIEHHIAKKQPSYNWEELITQLRTSYGAKNLWELSKKAKEYSYIVTDGKRTVSKKEATKEVIYENKIPEASVPEVALPVTPASNGKKGKEKNQRIRNTAETGALFPLRVKAAFEVLRKTNFFQPEVLGPLMAQYNLYENAYNIPLSTAIQAIKFVKGTANREIAHALLDLVDNVPNAKTEPADPTLGQLRVQFDEYMQQRPIKPKTLEKALPPKPALSEAAQQAEVTFRGKFPEYFSELPTTALVDNPITIKSLRPIRSVSLEHISAETGQKNDHPVAIKVASEEKMATVSFNAPTTPGLLTVTLEIMTVTGYVKVNRSISVRNTKDATNSIKTTDQEKSTKKEKSKRVEVKEEATVS